MKDIETLLKPITERYFKADSSISITQIYDEVCANEKQRTKLLQKDIELMLHNSENSFAEADEKDKEFVKIYSEIS